MSWMLVPCYVALAADIRVVKAPMRTRACECEASSCCLKKASSAS